MDNMGVILYEFMRERSDPDLPYEVKPNLDLRVWDYHIVTNADGFRDKSYSIKKPENVFRIVILGDSITFGSGIEENRDVYHYVLEEMFHNADLPHDMKVEVIAAAVPGYDLYTELSMLKEKCLKYDPDLVMFAYCLNDMRDAVYSCEYAKGLHLGHSKPSLIKLPPSIRRFLRRSVLYSYLAYSVNLFVSNMEAKMAQRQIEEESRNAEKKEEVKKPDMPHPEPPGRQLYFPENSEWYSIYKYSHRGKYLAISEKYIFGPLKELAQEHGFNVVLVIFPAFEKNLLYFPVGDRYVFDDVHQTLQEVCEKYGFYTMDLKNYLRAQSFEEVAMDDCHLSLSGHKKAAESLYYYVRENFID